MKLLVCMITLMAMNASGAEWSIRWKAAKGESVYQIPYEPKSLQSILTSLPAGHPEADADINDGLKPSKSSKEIIGTFKGRRVIAVELEVPQTYYSKYFLIVAEVEDSRFMPIYIHQFAPGVHGYSKPVFKASEPDFTVTVTSDTIGTQRRTDTFRITCDLKSPPRTELGRGAVLLNSPIRVNV